MRPPPREGGFARCHPLVTFAYFAALVVASVFSLHPLLLGLTFCSALLYALLQRGAAALRLALLFLLPAVVLTALINPLFNHRGATVLFYLTDNPMTAEAFLYGLATGVLMGGILLWFSCMGPLFRSDKVVYLFGRVSPALSLTLSICLRFVPLLKARFGEVSMGQRCLGRGGRAAPCPGCGSLGGSCPSSSPGRWRRPSPPPTRWRPAATASRAAPAFTPSASPGKTGPCWG